MSDMATILVVDDDPIVRDVVVRYLERDGHRTLVAGDGDRADELLRQEALDLVVLDVMLPGRDGLALSRSIRSRSSLPIILLTARGEEADRIVGLELGADDYVTKPFSPRELVARVHAVLRRAEPETDEDVLTAGDVVLDRRQRTAFVAGSEVELTAREFDLVWHLAERPGIVVGRERILERVWGLSFPGGTRTVDVHVGQLRRKLDRPDLIRTVRGAGYKLVP